MFPVGTLVYNINNGPCIIGTVIRQSVSNANWLWVKWPECTKMVPRNSLAVA